MGINDLRDKCFGKTEHIHRYPGPITCFDRRKLGLFGTKKMHRCTK